MAANAPVVPNNNLIKFVDGTFDFDTQTEKLALFDLNNTEDTATYSTTNELATANGYTQGGITLTYAGTTRLAEAADVVTYDADDVTWNASGGSIVHRWGTLYESGTNNVYGQILADNTPLDVTVTDGNSLTYQWNASGIWTLT